MSPVKSRGAVGGKALPLTCLGSKDALFDSNRGDDISFVFFAIAGFTDEVAR